MEHVETWKMYSEYYYYYFLFALERFSTVAASLGCGQKCCGDFPKITFVGGPCSLLPELGVVCKGERHGNTGKK